ncbi:MAG: SlyX family protein [Gammaproteobacteria bacterium]|nr:SlyX family protein [Gammaproteobacteria bacterium]
MSMQDMNERVVELETRLAFQDDVVNQLNEVIAAQRLELDELMLRMRRLEEQMKQALPSLIKSEAEETPPPHY